MTDKTESENDDREPTIPYCAERLKGGAFSISEACILANVSPSKLYKDARAGLVIISKRGSASHITGPNLAPYIAGTPATPENSRIPPLKRRKAKRLADAQHLAAP